MVNRKAIKNSKIKRYSLMRLEEYKRLLNNVLKVEENLENLENGGYSEISFIERAEMIKNWGKDIRNYSKNVPEELKKEHGINLEELIGKLFEAKANLW